MVPEARTPPRRPSASGDAPAAAAPVLDLGRLLVLAAALATAVAGVGHLSAARDHPAHRHITAFFILTALAQFAWAAAITHRTTNRLLQAGLLGNAAIVAIWAISRTTGMWLIPGADHVEGVAVKDVVTTFAELFALGAGALALALPDPARRAIIPSPDRVLSALVAAALLFSVPAALGPNGHGASHGVHGRGHGETDARVLGARIGHDHGESEVHEASGHVLRHDVEHVAAPMNRAMPEATVLRPRRFRTVTMGQRPEIKRAMSAAMVPGTRRITTPPRPRGGPPRCVTAPSRCRRHPPTSSVTTR